MIQNFKSKHFKVLLLVLIVLIVVIAFSLSIVWLLQKSPTRNLKGDSLHAFSVIPSLMKQSGITNTNTLDKKQQITQYVHSKSNANYLSQTYLQKELTTAEIKLLQIELLSFVNRWQDVINLTKDVWEEHGDIDPPLLNLYTNAVFATNHQYNNSHKQLIYERADMTTTNALVVCAFKSVSSTPFHNTLDNICHEEPGKRSPKEQLLLAQELINQEMYGPAVITTNSILNKYQSFYQAYLYRGISNLMLGRDQAALDDFQNAFNKERNIDTVYFLLLGFLVNGEGEQAEAVLKNLPKYDLAPDQITSIRKYLEATGAEKYLGILETVL